MRFLNDVAESCLLIVGSLAGVIACAWLLGSVVLMLVVAFTPGIPQ